MTKQKLRLGTVAFSPKDKWNAETEYKRLNVVHFLASSYYAKKDNVGQTPALDSEYWGLLVEGGDVVNNPDEEDITTEVVNNEHVLKLADKEYRPEKFSGKGYKRLRKNIQKIDLAVTKITVNSAPTKDGEISITINNIDTHISLVNDTHNTPALVAQAISDALVPAHTDYDIEVIENIITLTRKHSGEVAASAFDVADTEITLVIEDSAKFVRRNLLIEEMINQSNTIYEIMYDFDLDGTTINLPQNCILKFCGGSLNNGKLNGDKSIIEASPVRIFGKDIEISGTFVNSLNYAEWFDLDYEKTLLSFYGIDFIGNYLISKKISVDTGTNRIYLKFHPQSKITVNPTFIDDYLFDIKVSEVKDTTVRCDFNSVSGQGEIDLSERCGLISFTSSNKIGNLSAKGTDFSDLLNVHHAGKSIDNTVPTYDSNAVVNTAIIKVASESHFTNVNIYATRRYLASIPDCGILLQGTDHKLDRVTVVISTIGIYGIQGYTFIQDCHVWGAPHIAFYITGYHTINNTYGDWALCGFYLKGINYINITNYCVIGTTSSDSSVADWFQGNKMCLIKCQNPYVVTGHISYFQTRARNLRVLSNDEGNLEIADSSFLTYENIFDKNYRTYIRKQFDNLEESDGNQYYYKISGKFYNHLLKLIFTLNSNISSCYLLKREVSDTPNYVLEESYNTYLSGRSQISAYYNIGETDTMLISFNSRYSKFYVEYYNREKPLIVEKITKEDFDSNISTLNKLPILKENMLFSDYPNMSHLPIYFKDIESVVSVVKGSKDKCIKTVGIPEYNKIKSLQIIPKSVCYSSISNKIAVYQDNARWMSDDFAPIDVLRRGHSSERPSLYTSNYGFEYYDRTLKKKILWNGTDWVNLNGSPLDLKKSGTTAERPANVEIGFIYKDTTLNKLILWEGTKWVNLDGSELS